MKPKMAAKSPITTASFVIIGVTVDMKDPQQNSSKLRKLSIFAFFSKVNVYSEPFTDSHWNKTSITACLLKSGMPAI
jgi:hypothetical protein